MPASSKKIKKYVYVKHTADIEFFAFGNTPSSLLKNSVLALSNVIADTKMVSSKKSAVRSINLTASSYSLEDLLWKILQRALSHTDADKLFAYAVRSMAIKKRGKKYEAKGVILCKDSSPEASMLDVKGVSKYDMHISSVRGILKASVVLDV